MNACHTHTFRWEIACHTQTFRWEKGIFVIIGSWFMAMGCQAQFTLDRQTDSLYVLTLTTDSTRHEWRLPYPVYRMETGDVDGNGTIEALVGVIKPTRFYPEMGRRLFIFKNYHGLVRPLWMGSKLGGILEDFRFTDGKYVVAEYRWAHFGMGFERFLLKNVTREEAIKTFNN